MKIPLDRKNVSTGNKGGRGGTYSAEPNKSKDILRSSPRR